MIIQMVIIEKSKIKINLIDKLDEIEKENEVDNKAKKKEQYIWFSLLPLLPQLIIVKLDNNYNV